MLSTRVRVRVTKDMNEISRSTLTCKRPRSQHRRTTILHPRFLKSKGSAPLTLVMETFSVPRRWLASHEDFLAPR